MCCLPCISDFSIFFDRKNSWEWLSLFFFFLAVVVSVNSTKWLSYLLPFLSFHATVTIYWIARIGLNYCVFIFVYRRCQRRVDKWLKKLVLLISCAFIGMILAFPPDQATQYIAAWNLVSTLMYIFILVLLIWSLRSKEEGAWYEFLAFCLFAIGSFVERANHFWNHGTRRLVLLSKLQLPRSHFFFVPATSHSRLPQDREDHTGNAACRQVQK
ncbi:hypothetical protein HP425_01400 [Brevibacillus sp. HD1.4A]|nr:hypothetical protein [Brevibacillus sp. HD1.4A]